MKNRYHACLVLMSIPLMLLVAPGLRTGAGQSRTVIPVHNAPRPASLSSGARASRFARAHGMGAVDPTRSVMDALEAEANGFERSRDIGPDNNNRPGEPRQANADWNE